MTTQKVEKALKELKASGQKYHDAATFDNKLYWLRNLQAKAMNLKDEIAETLGGG